MPPNLETDSSSKAPRGRPDSPARLRGLVSLLVALALIALVSLAISWPLWIFATRSGRVYTILVLVLGLGAALYLVFRAVLRRRAARRAAMVLACCLALGRAAPSLFAAPASPQPAPAQTPALSSPSQTPAYPALSNLGPEDAIYMQQQEQLQASYTALRSGGTGPALVVYSWTAPTGSDLFSLAARLNLPYETLATLNGLDRARPIGRGERFLVPSAPGIFVREEGASDLDYLLSWKDRSGGESLVLARPDGKGGGIRYRFFRGERFSAEERALFLGLLFRFPLPHAVLTSGFGSRVNPVTGKPGVHQGVDLAAPSGTEVYAVRDGKVTASGTDPVLGEYIVIAHEGDFQTVYGHLSRRLVRLNDQVDSGMLIARVGSTGQSTGPHLHFEVRLHGEARDPEAMIPKVKR